MTHDFTKGSVRGVRRKLSEAQELEVTRLYGETETPVLEISERFGIGESSVYRVAQRHGAALRGRRSDPYPREDKATAPGVRQRHGTRRKLNEAQELEVTRLYGETETPVLEISERFSIGESSVYRVAQRHGAALRGRRSDSPRREDKASAPNTRRKLSEAQKGEMIRLYGETETSVSEIFRRFGINEAISPRPPHREDQATEPGVCRRHSTRRS